MPAVGIKAFAVSEVTQFGKLRASRARCSPDLEGQLDSGLVGVNRLRRGSPLHLVRLWCSGVVSTRQYSSGRWVGLLPWYGESATKGGGSEEVPEPRRSGSS